MVDGLAPRGGPATQGAGTVDALRTAGPVLTAAAFAAYRLMDRPGPWAGLPGTGLRRQPLLNYVIISRSLRMTARVVAPRECSKEHYHSSIVPTSNADPRRGSPAVEHRWVTSVSSPAAPSGSVSRRPVQAQQATLAARRYFIDGWTIKQIASELDVSRFKAARLLDWARAEGIVRIEIVTTGRSDVDLSAELRSAFGLREAVVVADLDGSSEAVGPELAEMAALVVAEVVTASDVVGVSWGRTLDLVVERLASFQAHSVVQLVGRFRNARECVRWDRACPAVSGKGEHARLPAPCASQGARPRRRRSPAGPHDLQDAGTDGAGHSGPCRGRLVGPSARVEDDRVLRRRRGRGPP